MLDYKATLLRKANGVTSAAELRSTARLRQDIEKELGCERGVIAPWLLRSGHLASHAEKIAAERAAARVRGVKAIVSELEVSLPDSSLLADDEIAKVAIQALSWNTQIPADRIQVRVEHGRRCPRRSTCPQTS